MFKRIKERWALSRADALFNEVNDLMVRVNSLDEDIQRNVIIHLLFAYKHVIKETHNVNNISVQGKKEIAKELLKLAQESFDLDMAKGFGVFLCSSYFEALTLPGSKAKMISNIIDGLIESECKNTSSSKRALDDPISHEESVVLKAVVIGLDLGATSAREVAEITMGRNLTDLEWEQYKQPWENGWNKIT
ncbi:hypothetical protein ACR30L_04440 [Psychromonas sp. PT13]|uniref:hypothetical protein n=1 Tax=Psychromonas sp. PT13 TaxID=3439547 RepID=UPI003EB74B3B